MKEVEIDLHPEVKRLLDLAGETWEDRDASDAYMKQALSHPMGGIDVLIGAYRFYFYRHEYEKALDMAASVVEQISKKIKIPDDPALFTKFVVHNKEKKEIRLYITALMAAAFVNARTGKKEEARLIALLIKSFDEKNEFGADFLLGVLNGDYKDED